MAPAASGKDRIGLGTSHRCTKEGRGNLGGMYSDNRLKALALKHIHELLQQLQLVKGRPNHALRFSAPNGTYENASLELPAADTLGTHGTCLLLICLLILLTVLSDEDLQVMPTGTAVGHRTLICRQGLAPKAALVLQVRLPDGAGDVGEPGASLLNCRCAGRTYLRIHRTSSTIKSQT
ncbi:hypothetical protein WJX84_008024 [Apatococcus fuscideae]|uniref:Uncharacterized protein n=1 Tax=Apatococcus fuscideae TaxID=2026836 RepID=A0AAW1SWX1_9CHLO